MKSLISKHFKYFQIKVLISTLFFASVPTVANSNTLENCKISDSKWNIVSLGFPIRPERLANLSTANLLVVPYQLKGEPKYSMSESDKNVFERAAKNIGLLSYGKLRVNYVFNSTVELTTSASDLDRITRNAKVTWQKNFAESPYGFVSRVLKENDNSINYKGIDGVVLYGKSAVVSQIWAEAFMFTNDEFQISSARNDLGGNWFDPIRTEEGEISNVVLLYNRLIDGRGDYTLTHELLHIVGLTDLYGGQNSPPLSMMSSADTFSLLPYEQFVLGWLPDNNITCLNREVDISQNLSNNRFDLNYSNGNQSLIIPTGTTTALVIDVVSNNSKVSLLYYSLDNDKRPPIETFPSKVCMTMEVNLSNYGGILCQLISPEYTVLISDNDGSKVTINIIPSKQIDTQEAINLINDVRAKAEADAKARAEAFAKAAVKKKTTITCVKGKTKKKVTAIKPKCPKGYKKK